MYFGSKMKSNNTRYEVLPTTGDFYCGDKCLLNHGMEKSFEIGTIDGTNIMSLLLFDLS
jgi:hypothetical protein